MASVAFLRPLVSGRRPGVLPRALGVLGLTIVVLGGPEACRSKRLGRPTERPVVEIEVTNNNMLDMTIYAVGESGSPRVRLGTVSTSVNSRFTLTLSSVSGTGQFRLLADPVGSRGGYYSEVVHVFSGQIVEWQLMPSLNQSVLTIRN